METIGSQDKVWIQRRVKATGVPSKIALPILALFSKWAECSGLEWTISRFKAIKNDFVRLHADQQPVCTWIKTSGKRSHRFGGPVGILEQFALSDLRHFEQALALLNIYTNFYSDKPTKAQITKFVTAVAAPQERVPDAVKRTTLQAIGLAGIRPFRKLKKADPLLIYNPSATKWAPTPFGRKPEQQGVVDSVGYLTTQVGYYHYQRYREYYDPVLLGLNTELRAGGQFVPAKYKYPNNAPVAGRIGLIQEAGFKLRAVANPGRVFQQVLSPLGKKLFSLLRDLPWDCTFDQQKADSVLLAATAELESKKLVFSVDLSNATDYFPLDLQLEVLYALFPHDTALVRLFNEVSRFDWECNLPDEDLIKVGFNEPGRIQWNKGQPLGLYPSFASFALTHGLLLLGLLGRAWNEDFFILGDDVVILDQELYNRYVQTLDELGCPVSPQKTLISSHVAEFHSTIFTDGRKIPSYKWRRPSDDSFLDITKSLGPRLVPLLSSRQKEVVRRLAPLPEEMGGLGWNPKGLSLSQRIDPWMKYWLRDETGVNRITDYSSLISEMLWTSTLTNQTRKYGNPVRDFSWLETFDQKVASLIQVSLGDSFVPLRRILGLNLDKVVDNVDLPIPGVRGSQRVTSLMRWEKVLLTFIGPDPQ
jgi:hypothetical protein